MKHLFVVRRGGETQDLAKAMKDILNGDSAYIVSSSAQESSKSSEALAEQLAAQYEKMPCLWDYDSEDPLADLMETVNNMRTEADSLVLVMGMEGANFFPKYFLRKELDIVERRVDNFSKGDAIHFDLEAKTYKLLP